MLESMCRYADYAHMQNAAGVTRMHSLVCQTNLYPHSRHRVRPGVLKLPPTPAAPTDAALIKGHLHLANEQFQRLLGPSFHFTETCARYEGRERERRVGKKRGMDSNKGRVMEESHQHICLGGGTSSNGSGIPVFTSRSTLNVPGSRVQREKTIITANGQL